MTELAAWSALSLGAAAVTGLLTLTWLASLARRDASLVDRVWGLGFVVLAIIYAGTAPRPGGVEAARVRWLLVALVALWGIRLSIYLTVRNWGHGEDRRYREMRDRGGRWFPLVSLFTIHLLQAALMLVVALPLFGGLRAELTWASPLTIAGMALWLIGFGFEAVGDFMLARFRRDPTNRGKVLDRGPWHYTRHPNYFGDACLWWGFGLFGVEGGAWWVLAGPIVMTILLRRISGVTLLERHLVATRPDYRNYVERTSAFLPWPPRAGRGKREAAR